MIKKMFRKFLGFDEEDDIFDNHEDEEIAQEEEIYQKPQYQTPVMERRRMEIKLYPRSYEDACEVIEQLEKGNTVIVDLTDVDLETSKRITDFIAGALYVLNGDVEKISKRVFRFWIIN